MVVWLQNRRNKDEWASRVISHRLMRIQLVLFKFHSYSLSIYMVTFPTKSNTFFVCSEPIYIVCALVILPDKLLYCLASSVSSVWSICHIIILNFLVSPGDQKVRLESFLAATLLGDNAEIELCNMSSLPLPGVRWWFAGRDVASLSENGDFCLWKDFVSPHLGIVVGSSEEVSLESH